MAFRVGQRVVCVREVSWVTAGLSPLKGEICTIHDIVPAWTDGAPALVLAEYNYWNVDEPMHFHASRFRPLVTRKADISALKALLEPAKVRERV